MKFIATAKVTGFNSNKNYGNYQFSFDLLLLDNHVDSFNIELCSEKEDASMFIARVPID